MYRVAADPAGQLISPFHGTTVHGRQRLGESRPEPLTYYHRDSPVADVLRSRTAGKTASIGAVGPRVGSPAAYVQAGQHWTFYEIDPTARDTRYFTFLSACGAPCNVVIGDARLSLENRSARYGVLVLDRFQFRRHPSSSDDSRGDLNLLIAARARWRDGVPRVEQSHPTPSCVGAIRSHPPACGACPIDQVSQETDGRSSSDWVVLARGEAALGTLSTDSRWQPLAADSNPVWTDDFSNIWSAIEWRR